MSENYPTKAARLEAGLGLPCPACGETGDQGVKDTRATHGGLRRRRTCASCGQSFSTFEAAVPDKLPLRGWGHHAAASICPPDLVHNAAMALVLKIVRGVAAAPFTDSDVALVDSGLRSCATPKNDWLEPGYAPFNERLLVLLDNGTEAFGKRRAGPDVDEGWYIAASATGRVWENTYRDVIGWKRATPETSAIKGDDHG